MTLAEFDLTEAIKDMHSGDLENNGFMIITNSPKSDQAASSGSWWGGLWTYWISSENNNSANRPKLVVEYSGGTSKAVKFKNVGTKSLAIGNLTKNQLVINGEINGVSEISLYNTAGKRIVSFRKNITGNCFIDLKNISLTNGAYLIKINNKFESIIESRVIR